MTPLREAVIAALEAEIERIESVRGAWRGDAADRHATITEMLEKLKSEKACTMRIDLERDPTERIKI